MYSVITVIIRWFGLGDLIFFSVFGPYFKKMHYTYYIYAVCGIFSKSHVRIWQVINKIL